MARGHREAGQAMIEMGLILMTLLTATAGLLDVGRAFYQYNAIASAARIGARFGSVVGGTCASATATSSNDWCSQLGQSTSTTFWRQAGNAPAQANNTTCPTDLSSAASPSPYYSVSNYLGTSSTTIVGAIAHHFDTTSTSTNTLATGFMPGFDLSKLKVCIQLAWDSTNSVWATKPGDRVTVFLYYAYAPVTPLVSSILNTTLVASSEYVIE